VRRGARTGRRGRRARARLSQLIRLMYGADHAAATLVVLPAPRVLIRLLMTYSTTTRLMPQPAPGPRAVLRSLMPKTPYATARVNTCVPAPNVGAYAARAGEARSWLIPPWHGRGGSGRVAVEMEILDPDLDELGHQRAGRNSALIISRPGCECGRPPGSGAGPRIDRDGRRSDGVLWVARVQARGARTRRRTWFWS
jgi:hypothetical protein